MFDQVISRLAQATEPDLRTQVACALFGKARALRQLGLREEAIQVYDHVVERSASGTEPTRREQALKALIAKASVLGDLHRWEDSRGLRPAGGSLRR